MKRSKDGFIFNTTINKILLGLLMLLLILGGVYFSRVSSNTQLQKSVTSNAQAQSDNSTQKEETTNSTQKFDLYFYLDQETKQETIRKEIRDGSTQNLNIKVEGISENGSCKIEAYKTEGVSPVLAQELNFIINTKTTSINNKLNLGEGSYRVDVLCKFNSGNFSKSYFVDFYVTQRIQKPVSYLI